MKLYTRAAIAVIVAFLLTYTVLGIAKSRYTDPDRRQDFFELSRPTLTLAVETLRGARDDAATLRALRTRLGAALAIEPRDRNADSGWFMRGDEMFSFLALDQDRYVVYGPFPELDPRQDLMNIVALGTPLVLACVIAFVLVAPISRRIHALARATQRLAEGDLAARAPDQVGKDAISGLARRFNQMATQLERLVEGKRELLQAVSHEFRTPSSRIRFDLEMLSRAKTPLERHQRIDSIDDSLVELDELVDELLAYSRFDGNVPDLPTAELDMVDIARGIAREIGAQPHDVDIRIADFTSYTCHPLGNERYFRRALHNLMVNGTRYAESTVVVSLREAGEWVRIEVEDDGPGIPQSQRMRVFEPFARVEESRDRQHGGAGLGLAIVARICEWHGAKVGVEDSETGALLVIEWPMRRDDV